MTDSSQDEESRKDAAASVWARGGEGPHAVIMPEAAQVEQTLSPPTTPVDIVEEKISPQDSEVVPPLSSEESSSALESLSTDPEDVSARSIGVATAAADISTPVAAGDEPRAPGPNDFAVAYMIPLVLYFVIYSLNAMAGGYCFTSARMNALAEIAFFWTPAACAFCLLAGSRWVKLTGLILSLPLACAAIFGCQYFHLLQRFSGEVSPYGLLAKEEQANGWNICRYEANWDGGPGSAVTYTREKAVGPYFKYVRKMRLGEPP